MKSHKNFINVVVFLLLNCLVSSAVFALFDQRFMKLGNLSNKPAIIVVQGDSAKKIIQRDLLFPSGALALVALLEPTEIIEIGVDDYLTTISGFSSREPQLAFRANGDNGFETVEAEGNGFRYPITSQCVPLINSTQILPGSNRVWPTRMLINNRTSSTIVFTQKFAGTTKLVTFSVAPNATGKLMDFDRSTWYLEITFPGTNLRISSFKYRDPEINIEQTPDGVVFGDGTYRYFISGKNAPKITAP